MANPHKRDGYVGIANEIMDALAGIRIPGQAWQVLCVIMRKTYGFNKKEDWIAGSQFMKLTGMKRQHVYRAINHLLTMNIVTKKGYGITVRYSFQKDYDAWKAYPKKVRVTQKGVGVPKKDSGGNQKRFQSVPKKGTHNNNNKNNTTKDNIAAKKPAPNPDVKIISQYFGDNYQKELGIPYVSNFGKDGAIIKGLLKIYKPDQIQKLIDKLLTTDDQFINSTDRGIGILKSQVNKLAQWCREDKKLLEAIKMRKPVESEPELTVEQRADSDKARQKAVQEFKASQVEG